MSRTLAALDRLVALVLGVALIALGLAAIAWQIGTVSWTPREQVGPGTRTATAQDWWPWATGAGGVILILLGLWWLAAHIPRRKLGQVRLPGSGAAGILRADTTAVAGAAAESLAAADGVQSASGRSFTDRGRPTIALTATVDPMADLAVVRDGAARVRGEITQALDGAELATRIHLHVGKT